jgi:hypothetical protein
MIMPSQAQNGLNLLEKRFQRIDYGFHLRKKNPFHLGLLCQVIKTLD